MTPEQVSTQIQAILQDVATIKARQAADSDRIEENRQLSTQVHKLAANLESLTDQIKQQNVHMQNLTTTIEQKQRVLGERVGKIEVRMERQDVIDEQLKAGIVQMQTDVKDLGGRLADKDKIYKKAWGIIATVLLTAAAMFVARQFGIY